MNALLRAQILFPVEGVTAEQAEKHEGRCAEPASAAAGVLRCGWGGDAAGLGAAPAGAVLGVADVI